MELDIDNLKAISLGDLELIYEAVRVEIDHRFRLLALPQQAQQIAAEYERAVADKPPSSWSAGLVVGPGEKVVQGGIEFINVSKAWLSASPAEYPLGYRRMTTPAEPVKDWAAGEAVTAGVLRKKNGVVYQCITGHTTAAHWAPDLPGMTALWIVAVEPAAQGKAK